MKKQTFNFNRQLIGLSLLATVFIMTACNDENEFEKRSVKNRSAVKVDVKAPNPKINTTGKVENIEALSQHIIRSFIDYLYSP